MTPDQYDETRLTWLREHPHTNIQKRRAQLLNQQIKHRKRDTAGAGADPADDNVIPPLWSKDRGNPSATEAAAVAVAAVLAPIGWPLGLLLYRRTAAAISPELPSYPIAAMLWTAVTIGLLEILAYWPTGTLATTLACPWLLAQIPATFAAAGTYGILNGWLPTSTGWWPTQPPPPTSRLAQGLGLGGDQPDTTKTTRPALYGLAACLLGAIWMTGGVITALLTALLT